MSSDSLNFGTRMKWQTDSQVVYVFNTGNSVLQVEDVNVYGMDLFFLSDTSFSLDAGDSAQVTVHFTPRHNMNYNGELVIVVRDRGAFRVDLRAIGQYPGTYYSTTFDLSEEALKTALKQRLALGYTQMGYNVARDWIFMSIDNEKLNGSGAPVNTLSCVYTGRQITGYVSRTDAQTNGNFNTEHTYPQSKFGSAEPMQSDMFHLFAVDEGANSRRSNHPFAVVSTPSWTEGGAKYGDSRFEPRDVQKGNTARAMLYFVTRYQNYDNFLSVLVPNENGVLVSQETLLRTWVKDFPATPTDSLRNEKIFALQKNRNPYIDHPEFLERIRSIAQTSVAPVVKTFNSNMPAGTVLRFIGESGDTTRYRLSITNTGNTEIPVSVSTKNGTVLLMPSALFNVQPGASHSFEIVVVRSSPTAERDTLVISSSAIANSEIKVPVEIDYFHTGLAGTMDAGLKIYPNPADDRLFIELEGEGPIQVNLLSLSGKKVTSTVLNGSLNEISLNGLTPGFYFVEVIQGTTQCRRALVIR